MELHIQKCQHCGSRELRNILLRSEKQLVFVQCRQCGSLVARYTLSHGGYYHTGKGYESFLRSIERDGEATSGRNMQERFHGIEGRVAEEFAHVQQWMKDKYGDNIP